MDYSVDLFTTYSHDSDLQVITELWPISTVHKSLHAKSSPACSVLNSCSLATASKSGDPSASRAQILSSQPSAQNSAKLSVNLLLKTVLLISRHGPHRTHQVFIVVVQLLKIPSRCPETTLYIRLSRGHCIATTVHATILSFNCWLTLEII
jgi:hypothetical protein